MWTEDETRYSFVAFAKRWTENFRLDELWYFGVLICRSVKIIFFVEKVLDYWFRNECLNNNALNYIKNPLGLKVNGNDKTGEMVVFTKRNNSNTWALVLLSLAKNSQLSLNDIKCFPAILVY